MRLLFSISLLFSFYFVNASHITGGEMIYEYIGPGATANTKSYRITLRLFRDDASTGAQMPTQVRIGLFDYGTKQQYPSAGSFFTVNRNQLIPVTKINAPCISNSPVLNYTMGTYPFVVDLPENAQGYIAVYETCCRINNITNVNSPNTGGGAGGTGSTYTARIPGSAQLSTGNNSSSQFPVNVYVVCAGISFTWDFGALDTDGDSLVYSFADAYLSLIATSSAEVNPATPSTTPPPDYPSVPYIGGFSGASPLGSTVFVNPNTGLIFGIAPNSGLYVVCVIAKEYRNGLYIGEHRKDLILRVAPCDVASATLPLDAVTCDGFTQTFQNLNNSSLINSYFWDFGVPGIITDTSSLQFPVYTYSDTGIYTIKLIINKGQACSDSATRKLGVYPGFFPAFNSTGVCYNSPIQFNDASTTNYGVVDSWRWDFGDAAVLSDTSRIKNPQYQYPSSGAKNVQLIVTNSKGCIDTLEKPIVLIDKPTITLPFKDTLICSIDTLQLQSTFSSGNATWTPNYRIINPNTNNPFVYPLITTTYTVTSNDQGCIQTDTVRVNVKDFVTVNVMPDTAICLTDRVILRTNSDALSYIWTPTATLNDATIQSPIATPVANTTKYYVSANIGKCQSSDSVTIIASPYPKATVNNDTTICFGDKVQLVGTATGFNFNWSPLNGLINFNTLTPTASPVRTTMYILTTQGAPGCPKPAFDTIVVTVIPPIRAFAGNDTTVVTGQPLQLNASGSTNYLWTPRLFLNNDTISNPIATLINNQTYVVRVSSVQGCFAYDTIKITVFQTEPSIFVPTAFTPNADGVNDILVPIPVGLKSYDYFEVYNRWGNKMYFTTQIKKGWDGNYKGVPQITDTYVWQVRGTDYTGKVVYKKGTVILLR